MAIYKGGKGRDDHFSGTEANDRFLFAANDLTITDGVIGRGGFDRLVFTAPGDVSGAAFVGVSGIERIELADGGMSVNLLQQLVDLSSTGTLVVVGGSGADVIHADGITLDQTGSIALTLKGGDGNDILAGGSGNSYLLDGGSGRDKVQGSGGIVVYDAGDSLAAMHGSATLRVQDGGRFDLTRADDQSLNDRCVTTGFSSIDASGSQIGVKVDATFYQSVVGGAGDDIIVGAGWITGGRGADHLIGSSNTETIFYLNAGDFVAGESIVASSANLVVSGSMDLRVGVVRGLDSIVMAPTGAKPISLTISGDQAANLQDVQAAHGSIGTSLVTIVLAKGDHLSSFMTTDGVQVAVVGSDASDVISVGTIVRGNGGNDVIDSFGTIFGGDGDDLIRGALDLDRIVDGGVGVDTFVLQSDLTGVAPVTIDLSARSQTSGEATTLRHFENFDGSAAHSNPLHVTGSAVDNVITGGRRADILLGRAGDDVLAGGSSAYETDQLDGGRGDDILVGSFEYGSTLMTGGKGDDTFRWMERVDESDLDTMDAITDFTTGKDHLEFYNHLTSRGFGFAGSAFDTRVVARGLGTDITDADLLIYTGGVLDSKQDVVDYLDSAAGGNGWGVFIAGTDSNDHTVLYYSATADHGNFDQIDAVADLGVGLKATDLSLSDFAFVSGFPG